MFPPDVGGVVCARDSVVFGKNSVAGPWLPAQFQQAPLIFSPPTLPFPPPGLQFQVQQAEFQRFAAASTVTPAPA